MLFSGQVIYYRGLDPGLFAKPMTDVASKCVFYLHFARFTDNLYLEKVSQ